VEVRHVDHPVCRRSRCSKSNASDAEVPSDLFGVRQQHPPETLPLKARRNSHVLNEKLLPLVYRLDQGDKHAIV
jgi:hypothetical protein